MTPKAAEEIAQSGLEFLAERPEDLAMFLRESGAEAGDLRAASADPAFLGFVLDFVLADDRRAEAFCAEAGLDPERAARARARLPGGESPNWL